MYRQVLGAVWLAAVLGVAAASTNAAEETAGKANADRLVKEALQAEIDGNLAQRRVLLSLAVDAAPENAPARWQSGQVFVDGEWVSADAAQDEAARDPRRIQYRALREAAGDGLAGQAQLARWCDEQKLAEEAAFHWSNVLAREPNHPEALRATDTCWYAGQRMSRDEAKAAKLRARNAKETAKRYKPIVKRWVRMLDAGDINSRDAALDEIRAVRDLDAIPAVEALTLNTKLSTNAQFERSLEIGLAFVAALAQQLDQRATDSLLRHAAVAPIASVRGAAVAALKRRSPHGYIPGLLSLLTMPFESTFRTTTDNEGGVHYWHSLYREGRDVNLSIETRNSLVQHDFDEATAIVDQGNVVGVAKESDQTIAVRKARTAQRSLTKYANIAAATEGQVAQINHQATTTNGRVTALLYHLTGQNLGNDPKAWWKWWDEYNEYYTGGERPTEERRYVDNEYAYYRMPDYAPMPHSCFAAGTLVWTRTGLEPIETLEIGDYVLAQDVNTGELRYKAVLGRTIRKARPTLLIACGSETIQATLGHPMWVSGKGWKMAKEVQPGDFLHGVKGPVLVDRIDAGVPIDVFNLVVADDHNYFISDAGLLVHDNTPRGATPAKLPGMVAD